MLLEVVDREVLALRRARKGSIAELLDDWYEPILGEARDISWLTRRNVAIGRRANAALRIAPKLAVGPRPEQASQWYLP